MTLVRHTYLDDPTIPDVIFRQVKVHVWPEFMFHDPIANEYWHHLRESFPGTNFALKDPAGAIVAVGHAAPFFWDRPLEELPDAGWDAVFVRAAEDFTAGRSPNVMTALEASVVPSYRGQGVSRRVIEEMRSLARDRGFRTLVAPVRPSWKARYPLTPIERYIAWTTGEGLPFDPWLRTHARMGARIVKVAPESMRITGTVAEWEERTGMRFPESGAYVVPGALVPVTIDRERDEGLYVEPNVWMAHTV
ncbi:MAG TPA: GNAT family N-acetyltransferase [Acidobacteriota bacterium]|nr:GNAT family N-acetyltransferase [Acidobacteriota bacterium]